MASLEIWLSSRLDYGIYPDSLSSVIQVPYRSGSEKEFQHLQQQLSTVEINFWSEVAD